MLKKSEDVIPTDSGSFLTFDPDMECGPYLKSKRFLQNDTLNEFFNKSRQG